MRATACTSIPRKRCSTCAQILAHLRPKIVARWTEKALEGVTVTIVGDILHSRVARSNMLLLPRLGARRRRRTEGVAAGAGGALRTGPPDRRPLPGRVSTVAAVMMLRIQAERLAGLQLDLDEYKASYQLTGQRLAAHAPAAVVLHPGPIIRGMEITAGVADGVQSAILEQVITVWRSAWR